MRRVRSVGCIPLVLNLFAGWSELRLQHSYSSAHAAEPRYGRSCRCALFGLPPLYAACRHALDALVEEIFVFFSAVLAGGAAAATGALGIDSGSNLPPSPGRMGAGPAGRSAAGAASAAGDAAAALWGLLAHRG